MMRSLAVIIVSCLLGIGLPARASDFDPAGYEFFEKNIRPVLAERCYQCHSAKSQSIKANLLLDSRAGTLRGGQGGPIIVPDEPEKSRLISLLKRSDPNSPLPPEHQLSAAQIAAFEEWIKLGAPDPRAEAPAAAPLAYDYEQARRFWSLQPVKDPVVPRAIDMNAPTNAIDQFIAAAYQANHVKPVGPADRRTLIRRATYDLTGLPPTPEEVHAFEAETSADAFAKVIDRLLASPAYGEQWGRHWLDAVRYADTSGCNSDFPIPDAYKYRDWVIAAFNQDKPYNQFLTEQLAGDLLPAANESEHNEHVIATGYLAIARRFGSGGGDFHLTIEDTIDNVGKTMLGLSINCARCHDHKFDPIPTSDYYALYGIFASTTFAFPGTEAYPHPKDLVALGSPAQAKELADYYSKLGELSQQAQKLKLEHETLVAREHAARRPLAGTAATQPAIRTAAGVAKELAGAKQELQQLVNHRPDIEKAYAVAEGMPADVRIQHKGDPKELGDLVRRGFLTVLGGEKLPPGSTGSGRLELANWITAPANPLTARVIVNRIWQHHFDVGLVKTPNDFGIRGQPPTNPALLDYLASRFTQSGGSVKSMHRLIMLSQTYQLASNDDANAIAADPSNDLLWRQNARRLSAEEIRDSLLSVGNSLDLHPAGPHPFPPENDWKYTQHRQFIADYPTTHRSVYLLQQRLRKQPFLAIFDGADTNAATGVRPLSTTAIQALYMMNDPLVEAQAARLAARVWPGPASDDAAAINTAFELCFNRPATSDEVETGSRYLHDCLEKLSAAGVAPDKRLPVARTSYLHVVLSSNEFIFLD